MSQPVSSRDTALLGQQVRNLAGALVRVQDQYHELVRQSRRRLVAVLLVVALLAGSVGTVWVVSHRATQQNCHAINEGRDALSDVLDIFIPKGQKFPPEVTARIDQAHARLRPKQC